MDRNEYTIQQQADGTWAVFVNGSPFAGGMSKGEAMSIAKNMESAQSQGHSEDEA